MARSKATIEKDKQILSDYLAEMKPELSEYEVRNRVAARHNVSPVTVWRAIKRAKEHHE
jgi:hypothetical protein